MSGWNPIANEIFLAALEISSLPRRDAFIREKSSGDAELLREVMALLSASEQAGSFLNVPAAAVDAQASARIMDQPAERSGTQIGPYKLVERIGEGGMGVVWMAQQTEPVRRVVAVKLIKAGMDSRQVIARFEAERQALALMDHPHIAKVLDGGSTTAGRPYFVMDLVRGVPITRYCDEHHLTPRQRLELFVPVCQAIQHAHQKGIIHRDLKPTNVLVALYDGQPVPKVIDFGVAKAAGQPLTEQTLVTGFGAIVGTLEYMSPEQAEINQLDIDTRSDIYSLGVLLYELLTGSPPFSRQELEQAGMLEMLRVIREEEPSKPSTKLSTAEGLPTLAANRGTEPARLTKLVRGELDWIVMKALEKDRNRRYETAAGFAADLERYLADEPVQACPPSVMYRLSKFIRRNKGAIAFATAGTLLLLVALGGIVGGVGWALRDRAAVRQQMAMQEGQRALKFRAEISAALDEAETSFQQDRLPQAMEAVRRAEGLLASAGGDDELGRRAGAWRANLAMVVRLEEIRLDRAAEDKEYIDWVGADEAYRQAFQDYGLDVEGLPPVEAVQRLRASPISSRLVAALDDWFVAKRHAGVAGWEEMLSLIQQVDTDAWRNRFREVFRTEQWPTLAALARDEKLLAQPPATVYLLSAVLTENRQNSPALEILLAAQKRHAGDFWINFHLGDFLVSSNPTPIQAAEGVGYLRVAVAQRPESPMVHMALGYALWKEKRPAEAETAFRRALALKPDFARAHLNLGVVLREQGKSEEGIAAYREAIRVAPNYGRAHLNLGFAVDKNRELDEAEREFREAVRCLPRDPPANMALANFLNRRTRLVEAKEVLRSYLRNVPDDLNAAQVHADTSYNLGHMLRQEKRTPEWIAAFQEARASFHNLLRLQPNDSVARNRLTTINSHLAMELKELGRWPEAIDVLEELVRGKSPSVASELFKILSNCPAPEHRNPKRALEVARQMVEWAPTAYNLQLLGWAEYRAGNWQASIDALDKSRKLQRNPSLGDPYQWLFLSMAHWKLGNREESRRWYDQSIRYMEYYNLDNPDLLAFHTEAAGVLGISPPTEDFWAALRKAQVSFQAGKWTQAEEEYRGVVASYPNSAAAHQRLGEALERQNRLKEAEDAIRQAIQLAPEEIVFLSYLASMLNRQRRGEESESLMREAVRLQPDNPWTHHWLGDSLQTQRRYTDAEAAFREALRLGPNNASHHHGFGDAVRAQGRVDEAKSAYREAIRLEPDNISHYSSLNDPTQWQQFIDWCAKATQTNPADIAAWRRLGSALVESRRWQEAVDALTRAIELDPAESAYLWQLRGRALAGLKEWERAVSDFNRAIELNPQDTFNLQNRSTAYRELKQFDKAIADGTRVIELRPDLAYSWALRGLAYVDARHWQPAVDDLNRALELDPDGYPYWWHFRGRAYAGLKQWERAIEDLTKAAELEPNSRPHRNHLGAVQYRAGMWQQALETLQKAEEMEGTPNSYHRIYLVLANWRLDKKHEALRHWVQFVPWMESAVPSLKQDQPLLHEELCSLRAEAEGLLGEFRDVEAAYLEILQLEPRFAWAHYGLADYLAQSGQWTKSAAAYVKALDLEEPIDLPTWLACAGSLVLAGDSDGYRKLCERMARRFGQNRDPHQIAFLAHVCVMAPNALGNSDRVVQLAEQRMALTAKIHVHRLWSMHVLGLAFYRAGQFEKAIASLEAGQNDPGFQTAEFKMSNWLVLAMSRHRLGQNPEAAAALESARAILAKEKYQLDRQTRIVQTLFREAESLLRKQ